jgi:general stress protein YciG
MSDMSTSTSAGHARPATGGATAKRVNRGNFAADPARAAAAGRKGGQSVPPESRSFSRDPTLAATAGRKGGQSVPAESRSFSQDRGLAAQAGRKGGQRSHGVRAAGDDGAEPNQDG